MTRSMPPSVLELAHEIVRVGRSLFDRGYVHATAGNISTRLEDGGFLITPTDACLGNLSVDTLAWVDANGQQISGARASKTLALHRGIYSADPNVSCVLHTHSTDLVALSLSGVWRADCIIPPITPYFVMKVGVIPQVAYARPGDPAVAAEVTARLRASLQKGNPIRGVLLERLGPVVWHRTPQEASATLEELEETAKLWNRSRPTPLSAHAIAELEQQFGVRWGLSLSEDN